MGTTAEGSVGPGALGLKLGKGEILEYKEKSGEHPRWRDWAEGAEVGRRPVTWSEPALAAERGDWHIWGSGSTLGDGERGERVGVGSLIVNEMNSHSCVGCPWEESWTKDPCPHSGFECV